MRSQPGLHFESENNPGYTVKFCLKTTTATNSISPQHPAYLLYTDTEGLWYLFSQMSVLKSFSERNQDNRNSK